MKERVKKKGTEGRSNNEVVKKEEMRKKRKTKVEGKVMMR